MSSYETNLELLLKETGGTSESKWLRVYSRDASIYEIKPEAVFWPKDKKSLQKILSFAIENSIPITIRGSGTSLSGQSVGPGFVVDVSRHLNAFEVRENGKRVWFEPGANAGKINKHLAPFGRKLGPDPASLEHATMGGILANNSSGMCCGVKHNSFHLVTHMEVLLANGTEINTNNIKTDEEFKTKHPSLFQFLAEKKLQAQFDPALSQEIERAFTLKNTMGYSLNAFTQSENIRDCFQKLLIGSEGTLGVITQAEMKTVENYTETMACLIQFQDLKAALLFLGEIQSDRLESAEFMDSRCLDLLKKKEEKLCSPAQINGWPESCLLLLEWSKERHPALARSIENAKPSQNHLQFLCAPTSIEHQKLALWKLRKGILPLLGASRPQGTSLIIEDVAFPQKNLLQGSLKLLDLLQSWYPTSACLFGHVKDGNFHFVLFLDTADQEEIQKYKSFMLCLSQLVLKEEGSLKAEHGTGRNMAPFLHQQWSQNAVILMQEIKKAFDPQGILNQDVILSHNPDVHIKHLKQIPAIHEDIDACIECGFCEKTCPTSGKWFSPRQRIVSLRTNPLPSQPLEDKDFNSCARDGTCKTACPVGIDTGAWVKKLKEAHQHSLGTQTLANGLRTLQGVVLGSVERAEHREKSSQKGPTFLKSCSEQLFQKPYNCDTNTQCRNEQGGVCCGLAFSSKGFPEQAKEMLHQFSKHHAKKLSKKIHDKGDIYFLNAPCYQFSKSELSKCLPERFHLKGAQSFYLDHFRALKTHHPEIIEQMKAQRWYQFLPCSVFTQDTTEWESAHLLKDEFGISFNSEPLCCGTAGDNGIFNPDIVSHALNKGLFQEVAFQEATHILCSSHTCGSSVQKYVQKPVFFYPPASNETTLTEPHSSQK